jgi:hypothetical protein
MKNGSIRPALALVVYGVLLLSLACGTAQNTSQNQGNSKTAATLNSACDEPNIGLKITKIQDNIIKQIMDDPELRAQYQAGKFGISVAKGAGGDFAEVFIKGEVSGRNEFEDLVGIIDDYMTQGCVFQVYTIRSGPSSIRDPNDFEWSICEYPMVACPTGECKADCGTATNTSMNTNGYPNSNANANSNVNANSNSGNRNK